MDALVLPLVGEDDPPDTAIRQMRRADVKFVVVERDQPASFRLLSNDEVLEAWARNLERLGDLDNAGFTSASLETSGSPVWRVLDRSKGLFSVESRVQPPTVAWPELEPLVLPGMNAELTDYAVLRLEGAAAVVFTRHEGLGANLRTRRRRCRCPHELQAVDERPPTISDGGACLHGGTYRCV